MEREGTVTSGASFDEWSSFFGQGGEPAELPRVTIDSALEIPAVLDAVTFLSRTLAALPLHAYREGEDKTEKVDGSLQMLLNEAPNEEWSSFAFRQYFWHQVFTGGRGLAWIERRGVTPVAIWPIDPTQTTVHRVAGRRVYRFDGKDYPADEESIDAEKADEALSVAIKLKDIGTA